MSKRQLPLFGIVAAALVWPSFAYADDHAIAEALFQSGKALMNEGKIDEACPKLVESQRIEPGGGTLLLLGMCHEEQGKLASAVAELRSAQSMARRDHRPDREKLAAKHLADIEGRVSTLVIRVVDRDATVKVDGTPITAAAAATPLPIDAGAHTIEVVAKSKKPRTMTITIGAAAENRALDVPALEPEAPHPEPPAASDGAPSPPSDGTTQRTIGFGLVGVGAVVTGIGAYFGLRAAGENADAKDLCDPSRCTSADGLAKNDDARSHATLANVTLGVGLAVAAAGVVVVLLAPKARPSSARAGTASVGFTF